MADEVEPDESLNGVATPGNEEPTARLNMPARVQSARVEAQRLASPEFREQLVGTAGNTPL